MTSYCRFLEENEWSSAIGTLTATSAATALPVTASQSPERTYVWRSLSQTADQVLTRDLTAARPCDFIAVANVRRHNAGTLKLYQGGTGASPSWSLVATLPDEDEETRLAVATFESVAARHWKLVFENGNPGDADYAECGYVGLGAAFEPSRACVVPVAWTPVDPSIESASVDGQASYTSRTPYAEGDLLFKAIDEADLTAFRSLYRTVGRRIPFFFALDTSLGHQQWLMRCAGDLIIRRRPVPGRYDVSFSWREAR